MKKNLSSIHFEGSKYNVKRDIATSLDITLKLEPDGIPSIEAQHHQSKFWSGGARSSDKIIRKIQQEKVRRRKQKVRGEVP